MPRARSSFVLTGTDALLYAGLIWGWSTSWYAIKQQLDGVTPEVSVFWRFLLTVPLMFGLSVWRGDGWRFPLVLHPMLALSGVLMFSTNFVLFYHAGGYLPSGLMAVVFALSSLINLLFGVLLWGEPFRWKLALGGVMGVAGVALLFQPQFAAVESSAATRIGLMLGFAATLCFAMGNQVSVRLQKHGARVVPAAAWGMAYGTVVAGFYALIGGGSFALPMTANYLGWLAFLILSATMLAFYTYLSLVSRIGAPRAAYATVIFPVFALLISTVLEGYRWTPLALAGVVLALAGNLLVLRRD